jgi:parallel beta-helix repeat protein
MKKPVLIAVLMLLLSMHPISGMMQTTQKTIYVDDDNINGPWDGSMEHPYQYIQDGIDAGMDGDMILVSNGIYREMLLISKSIIILGIDPQTTIIDGMNEGIAVSIFSNEVIIFGFTITNTSYPPYAVYPGIMLEDVNNCTIGQTIISDTGGITLMNTSDIFIASNTLHHNRGGIILSESSVGVGILGNMIHNNSYGIDMMDASNTMIKENTIQDNGAGISCSGSSENTIRSNDIRDNDIGIDLYSAGNRIMDNTITNNRLGGVGIFTSDAYISGNVFSANGIVLWGSTLEEWNSHTIEHNVVNGKPICYYKNMKGFTVPSNSGQVIIAHCSDATIQNCILSEVSAGIQIGFSEEMTISENILRDNTCGAIMLTESSAISIADNRITNSFYGISLSAASDILIGCNFITDADGQGISLYSSSMNIIHNNALDNNEYGIFLAYSSENILDGNTITNHSQYGIILEDAHKNLIVANNLISNSIHATFIETRKNEWRSNYWDDWPFVLPRLIKGEKLLSFPPYFILWFNIDWHPATHPYVTEFHL